MIYMPKKRLNKALRTAALAGFEAGKRAAIEVIKAHIGAVPKATIDAIMAVEASNLPGERKRAIPPAVQDKPPREVSVNTPCPMGKDNPHPIGTVPGCVGCNLHNNKVRAGKVKVVGESEE